MFSELQSAGGGGGGGLSNGWNDTWTSSTTYETKTIELPFEPIMVMSRGVYGTVWYRQSTSDSWSKCSINTTGYDNSYITSVSGKNVTFKNNHSGTNTYYLYAVGESV